jgi:hypothetical protein
VRWGRLNVTDDELHELHREAQALLALGVSPAAIKSQVRLERALCAELELDPFDPEQMDRMLDAVHEMCWPDPRSRPARLAIEGWGADPRE